MAGAKAFREWQSPRPRGSWSYRGCSEMLARFTGYAGFEDCQVRARISGYAGFGDGHVFARNSGYAGFEDCQMFARVAGAFVTAMQFGVL